MQRSVGGFVAEVRITGTDDVVLSWLTSEGGPKKSVPAAVREGHAAELKQLKKAVDDIAGILPAQKARLERLLESDSLIPFEKWRERYVCTSARSARCRGVSSGNSRNGSAPGSAHSATAGLLDVDDKPIDWVSPSSTVRLWHPLGDPT